MFNMHMFGSSLWDDDSLLTSFSLTLGCSKSAQFSLSTLVYISFTDPVFCIKGVINHTVFPKTDYWKGRNLKISLVENTDISDFFPAHFLFDLHSEKC